MAEETPERQRDVAALAGPVAVPMPPRDGFAGRARRALPAILMSGLLIGLAGIAADRFFSGGISGGLGLPVAKEPDNLTQRQRDEIARRFYAHGPIVLDAVRLRDLDKAIASMGLSADQERAFRGELASLVERDNPVAAASVVQTILNGSNAAAVATSAPAAAPPSQTPVVTPAAASPSWAGPLPAASPPAAAVPQPRPAPAPSPAPAPAVSADPEFRLPLAWVTVWDHVDEDGDFVRVVSSGYSRLIPILHKPVTLAVPMPPNGVVNVVGVKDGYGGITVGISSDAMPVVLPVLSEGQIVGVPVTLR